MKKSTFVPITHRSGLQSSSNTDERTAWCLTSSWATSLSSACSPTTWWVPARSPAPPETALSFRKQVWHQQTASDHWNRKKKQIVALLRHSVQAAGAQGSRLLAGSQVHAPSGKPLCHRGIQCHPQLFRQRDTQGQSAVLNHFTLCHNKHY